MADASTGKKKMGKRKSQERINTESERGPITNGFITLKEAPALRCKESNVAPYTMPHEALNFVPQGEDIVCLFKNGDKERKIHNNIELDDAEKAALAELQREAKEQNCAFLPSITAMATRFLSRARGDPKKAITLMQATQSWRLEYFKSGPVADDQVAEDLRLGIVYFSGRDSSLRPTIVVRPRRIPQEWYKLKCIDRMIRVLIFCMEYMLWYMLLPGRIENTNVIIDLKGLGLSQLPIGPLNDVYKVMSHHYIGRVFKFYVVNLTWVLSTISGAVKALLTDRQKQKLCILDDVKALGKDFALHQLEEDLGGSRPVIEDFFPFPCPPGPFKKEDRSGPVKGAPEGSHKVLAPTAEARQGRLFDPSKSKEDNIALDYSEDAYDLFERCKLPIPPNCKKVQEPPPPVASAPETNPEPSTNGTQEVKRVSKAMRASLREMGIVSVDLLDPEEDAKEESKENGNGNTGEAPKADTVTTEGQAQSVELSDFSEEEEEELQDEAIKPAGSGWWCRSCTVTSSAAP
jgi:hypothetical protein